MEKKPQIPTLKDAQRPEVKIKGLAASLSLVGRLKQFKKKDLAFILAGLGVLFTAPMAEHFMMSPESSDSSSFKPGWGFQAAGSGFGSGSSPYETGVNGMAPGGVAGGGTDVITPLNVRDPSALIMGPAAQQQAAATSVTPPTPPVVKESSDWKDAIANAAAKGASAATKAASLPVPKASLTNAGLRGLGVASGSSGSSFSLAPLSAAASHAGNEAAPSNSLTQVIKAPGYQGVGARSPQGTSQASLDALKGMAAKAGTDMNRTGSAATNLVEAASRNMPSGSGNDGMGQGGSGAGEKGPGGNQNKDGKTMSDSLAFLAEKDNQQQARSLYWKLQEKKAMLWPNLQEKLIGDVVETPVKTLAQGFANELANMGSGTPGEIICRNGSGGYVTYKSADVDTDCASQNSQAAGTGKQYQECSCPPGSGYTGMCIFGGGSGSVVLAGQCGSSDGSSNNTSSSTANNQGGGGTPPDGATQPLSWACQQLNSAAMTGLGGHVPERTAMLNAAQAISQAANIFQAGTESDPSCNAAFGASAANGDVVTNLRNVGNMVTGTGAPAASQSGTVSTGGQSGAVNAGIVPQSQSDLAGSAAYLDAVQPNNDGTVAGDDQYQAWKPYAKADADKAQQSAVGVLRTVGSDDGTANNLLNQADNLLTSAQSQLASAASIKTAADLGPTSQASAIFDCIQAWRGKYQDQQQSLQQSWSGLNSAVSNLTAFNTDMVTARDNVKNFHAATVPANPRDMETPVPDTSGAAPLKPSGTFLNINGYQQAVKQAQASNPPDEAAIQTAQTNLMAYRDFVRQQNGAPPKKSGLYSAFDNLASTVGSIIQMLPGGSVPAAAVADSGGAPVASNQAAAS